MTDDGRIAFQPSMDTETFEAIGTLRSDIRLVETRLDAKIEHLESSLRADMRQLREDLGRHFDIVAESLRDDIRIIAEGLIALDAKVERFRPPDGLP